MSLVLNLLSEQTVIQTSIYFSVIVANFGVDTAPGTFGFRGLFLPGRGFLQRVHSRCSFCIHVCPLRFYIFGFHHILRRHHKFFIFASLFSEARRLPFHRFSDADTVI